MKTPKKHTQKNLESHGIFYNPKIYDPNIVYQEAELLPDHVDAVREILLSFEAFLPDGAWRRTFQAEAKEYGMLVPEALEAEESSWIKMKHHQEEPKYRSTQWNAAFDELSNCEKVAEDARKLSLNAEDGWKKFWATNTFISWSERGRDQPGFHPILDNWVLEGDFLWTSIRQSPPDNSSYLQRTIPKPDLTYAFPVAKSSSDERKYFEKDEFLQGFSLEALGKLVKRGIICTPTKKLWQWEKSRRKTRLETKDLACFPWAVVEFKKQWQEKIDSLGEECYSQAANASVAALDLSAQLYAHVIDKKCSKVPPIISFTCVGPVVRVWLTYYAELNNDGKQKRKMICIWATTVQLTWGVAALRKIIVNMHTWASRLLKPKIQAWIFQALEKPPARHRGNSEDYDDDCDYNTDILYRTPRRNTPSTSRRTFSTPQPTGCPDRNGSPSPSDRGRPNVTRKSRFDSAPAVVLSSLAPTRATSQHHVGRYDSSPSPLNPPAVENSIKSLDKKLPTLNSTHEERASNLSAIKKGHSEPIDSSTQLQPNMDAEENTSDPTDSKLQASEKQKNPDSKIHVDGITESLESDPWIGSSDDNSFKHNGPAEEALLESDGTKMEHKSPSFSTTSLRFVFPYRGSSGLSKPTKTLSSSLKTVEPRVESTAKTAVKTIFDDIKSRSKSPKSEEIGNQSPNPTQSSSNESCHLERNLEGSNDNSIGSLPHEKPDKPDFYSNYSKTAFLSKGRSDLPNISSSSTDVRSSTPSGISKSGSPPIFPLSQPAASSGPSLQNFDNSMSSQELTPPTYGLRSNFSGSSFPGHGKFNFSFPIASSPSFFKESHDKIIPKHSPTSSFHLLKPDYYFSHSQSSFAKNSPSDSPSKVSGKKPRKIVAKLPAGNSEASERTQSQSDQESTNDNFETRESRTRSESAENNERHSNGDSVRDTRIEAPFKHDSCDASGKDTAERRILIPIHLESATHEEIKPTDKSDSNQRTQNRGNAAEEKVCSNNANIKSGSRAKNRTKGVSEDESESENLSKDESKSISENESGSASGYKSESSSECGRKPKFGGKLKHKHKITPRKNTENTSKSTSKLGNSRKSPISSPQSRPDSERFCKELESLTGYEVAHTPYLRVIFAGLAQDEQIDMIRGVLGSGHMPDDCFEYGNKDLLEFLLSTLNSFLLPRDYIKRVEFLQGRISARIERVSKSISDPTCSVEFRWSCFQAALSIRSQQSWNEILRAEFFKCSNDDRELLALDATDWCWEQAKKGKKKSL